MRELRTWNPASLGAANAILDWALARGASVTWGSGRQTGSFSPTHHHGGFPYQLVSVRTDGSVVLLFRQLRDSPAFSARARRLEALERLNQVEHFALSENVIDLRLSLPLAVLMDDPADERILEVLDWFENTVRSS